MSADGWREAYEGASANGERLGTENARLRAALDAARAELEAFAATPLPDELDGPAAYAAIRVTSPFVGRMRVALGVTK